MSLFRNKLYLAVTLGHFTVDVFSSMGPVIVTFFSVPLALSAAQIGLALGGFQLISASSQPIFGWLADRVGSRWLGPSSVAWAVGFLVIAVLTLHTSNNFGLFLIPFGLCALGVGAFHPQGAMHAGTSTLDRVVTATAVFFLLGQFGLASGPVLAGLMMDKVGPGGIYALALLAIPQPLFMAYAMRHVVAEPVSTPRRTDQEKVSRVENVRWGAISLLALLSGLRAWVFLGSAAFLPKIFQNMGWTATGYGLIAGTFWMASAVSGVIAGNLADRWGRRQVVFVSLLFGSLTLYFLPLNNGWLAFLLALSCGGLLGASHSILVVIAQALLPGRKALASGLTLGYIFGVGALAAWVIGVLADFWGLTSVIQAETGLGILAALLAVLLPSTREMPQAQVEIEVAGSKVAG